MAKLRPSASPDAPKVKRDMPELTSVPTMPTSRPSTIIAIVLSSEPCASTAAAISAMHISEKYSGAPNLSAISARGGPSSAIRIVPTVPAKNEPIAAMASAGPARPCFAI